MWGVSCLQPRNYYLSLSGSRLPRHRFFLWIMADKGGREERSLDKTETSAADKYTIGSFANKKKQYTFFQGL